MAGRNNGRHARSGWDRTPPVYRSSDRREVFWLGPQVGTLSTQRSPRNVWFGPHVGALSKQRSPRTIWLGWMSASCRSTGHRAGSDPNLGWRIIDATIPAQCLVRSADRSPVEAAPVALNLVRAAHDRWRTRIEATTVAENWFGPHAIGGGETLKHWLLRSTWFAPHTTGGGPASKQRPSRRIWFGPHVTGGGATLKQRPSRSTCPGPQLGNSGTTCCVILLLHRSVAR